MHSIEIQEALQGPKSYLTRCQKMRRQRDPFAEHPHTYILYDPRPPSQSRTGRRFRLQKQRKFGRNAPSFHIKRTSS